MIIVKDKVSDAISEYIDKGYLIICSNKRETMDVLYRLDNLGYHFTPYFEELICGIGEYDSGYPHVGLLDKKVGCYSRLATYWRDNVTYYEVVDEATKGDNIDDGVVDDFDVRLADLLS